MQCGHDFPCEIDEVANTSTKVCEVDLFVLTKVLCNITLKIHLRTSPDLPLTWQVHKKSVGVDLLRFPDFPFDIILRMHLHGFLDLQIQISVFMFHFTTLYGKLVKK